MYRKCADGLYYESIETGERKLMLDAEDYEVDGDGRIISSPRTRYCDQDGGCLMCDCLFCDGRKKETEG